jgi:glycosyltransferase involved in cell wall biosynthesis
LQLQPALERRGINLTVRPFVDSATYASLYDRGAWARTAAGLGRAAARRLPELWRSRRFDAVLVQREAMLFGPALLERAAASRTPVVLDLDDATYISYDSPTYGRMARWLKWPGKTDRLIASASMVSCGNQTIADYVEARGTSATIVPTVVDLERWTPRPPGAEATGNELPVVGWVGSHSTLPYVQTMAPALAELATTHKFRVLLVGGGRLDVPGAEIETRPWRLDREIDDFRALDVGLYPLPADDPWAAGKSGLKAVQYMAVGIPYVASPVGATTQIGEEGRTHLLARTTTEWHDALAALLDDVEGRRRMGANGRAHAEAHYTLDQAADALADALRRATA